MNPASAAGSTGSALASLLVLLMVLGAIPLCLWLVRRLSQWPRSSQSGLELTHSLTVGPRERIAVVRVDERWLVVGITGASMTVLAELDRAPGRLEESTTPSGGGSPLDTRPSFARHLSRRLSSSRRSSIHPPAALVWPGIAALGALLMLLAPGQAMAQSMLSLQQTTGPQGATWSVPIQTLLIFTALSFLPAAILMMTSFTRIVIVLSLVRQAIGLQSAPPNQVVIGMSLFLTVFVMGPTLDRVYAQAYKPFNESQITFEQAVDRGTVPLREFMLRQTRATDLALFARIAGMPASGDGALDPKAAPLRLLVPAFVISELKTAFQIGFMVFIPFILIDLVVASVLMSLGMMMVSPVLVSLPFKMILFVLADGWNLLVGSLVASFGA